MLVPKRVRRKKYNDEKKKSLLKEKTRNDIDGRTSQEMNRTEKPLSEIQKKQKESIQGPSGFRKEICVKIPENSEAGGDEIKTRAGHGECGPLEREKDSDLVSEEDNGMENNL